MKIKVQKILSHRTFIIALYFLFALVASIQSLVLEPKANAKSTSLHPDMDEDYLRYDADEI